MRILLAAKHAPEGPNPIGGVQTWCRTVKKELIRRGYDAVTWGPGQTIPLGGFDLGIIANAKDVRRAFDWCKKTVTVCHGIIPAEMPEWKRSTMFTSEGVREYWVRLFGSQKSADPAVVEYYERSPILRQPIDLEYWTPDGSERTTLTRFSYRTGLPFAVDVAKELNLKFRHVRNDNERVVLRALRQSACVLATGRAALEAMACGAPVVLVDHRASYQGPLMDLDIDHAMRNNYSGRGGLKPNAVTLREAVLDAMLDAKEKGSLRSHVERHHDVRRIVDQLLEYA